MRISTAWMQQASVNAMLNQQALVSKTQIQLSTGQRMAAAADDPGAAVSAQVLNQSLQTTQQYQSNIGTAQSRLQFEDSTLASADNVMQQARELTVQGLNDTLTANDRKALAGQAQQLLDEMAGLANTKNANGEYIFGGFSSGAPPFSFDAKRVPPSYVYRGDQQQRALQVGDQRQIADGNSGFDVFENVPSTSGNLAVEAAGGKQSILNTLYTLTQTLQGGFTGSHGAVVGTENLAAGIDYTSGARTFGLAVDGGPAATVSIAAGNYRSPDELAAAINAGIDATTAQGKAVAQVRDGAIEFVSTSTGTTSSVTVNNGTPGFLADAGLSDPQTGTGAAPSFHEAASAALDDIDAGLQRVLDIRASVGARLNALSEQQSMQDKFILDTQSNLSKLEDLDYAEAISRFSQQQTVLQASQQAFAKVQRLSLFDYL